MLPKLASLAVAPVLAAGALALAQPALATDYCVAPNDTCANKVMDIQTALDDAAATPGPDRVLLGAATYTAPAQGFIYDPLNSDDPVELVGAGNPATTVNGTTGAIRTLAVFGGSGTVISDMRIVMPPNAAAGAQAVRTNGTVKRVSVVDDAAETNDYRTGVVLLGAGVLDDAMVGLRDDHPTTGVVLLGGGTVHDAGVYAGTGVQSDGGGTIDQVTIAATSPGIAIGHGDTKVTSSRIKTSGFGSIGITAENIDGDASLEVDGATIVGPGGKVGTGIGADNAYAMAAGLDVVVKNTIIRGYPAALWVGGYNPGHVKVAVSYSDYDSSTSSVNAAGQLEQTNVSFVGDTGFTNEGDYNLLAGSPLVDAGDPTTAGGLDLMNNLLVTDGNGDGVARRDLGAIELPAVPLVPKPADGAPAGGEPAGQPAGPGVVVPSRDTSAPAISGLRVSRKVFTVGRARTAIAARSARGTRISYAVSENAKVVIQIRRIGAKRAAGKLTRKAKSGVNTLRFSGRIGAKALKPGRYRAIVTATDAAGNRSATKSVRFRIARHG